MFKSYAEIENTVRGLAVFMPSFWLTPVAVGFKDRDQANEFIDQLDNGSDEFVNAAARRSMAAIHRKHGRKYGYVAI